MEKVGEKQMEKVYLINPEFYKGEGKHNLPRFYLNKEKAEKFALKISDSSKGYVSDSTIISNIVIEMDYKKILKKMFK